LHAANLAASEEWSSVYPQLAKSAATARSGIGRIPGSTGNIRESRPEGVFWPSKPQPISIPYKRIPVAPQTGMLALLIGNYFRRTGNYLRRDGNCPASPNPPDFGARPDPGATPSTSRRPRRLADNPTSSSTTATLAARRSRLPNTANWAILPSPCPASGTIVCLEAPLAGLVPAIHAFLCLADRGRQDVDAPIKSDQARAKRVFKLRSA
jgi:hypothetical protein